MHRCAIYFKVNICIRTQIKKKLELIKYFLILHNEFKFFFKQIFSSNFEVCLFNREKIVWARVFDSGIHSLLLQI